MPEDRTPGDRAPVVPDRAMGFFGGESTPEARDRLGLALAAAGMGTWTWKPQSDEIFADERAHAIVGVEPGSWEASGRKLEALIHPEDRSLIYRQVRACLDPAGSGRFECEHRFVRPGGDIVWVRQSGKAEFEDSGRSRIAKLVVGTILDVTAQHSAEHAVHESERMLHAVLDQMPSGVFVAEAPSGQVVYHNDEAEQILGHPITGAEDFMGHDRYGWLHDDGTPYEPEAYPLARALHGEVVRQSLMRYLRRDGTTTTLMVNAAPVRRSDGTIVRAVTTFHDVSEFRKTRDALRRLNETLEQRVEDRTSELRAQESRVREMAARLSVAERDERRRISQVLHDDLQQALYAVEMKIATLARNLEAAGRPDLTHDAQVARSWIKQTVTTVRRLTVDISPPILERPGLLAVIEWLRVHMKDRYHLDVRVEADQDWPIGNVDLRVLLFQVVRELLFNVVKHADVLNATIYLGAEAEHLVIDVVDRGRGFVPAEVEARKNESHGFGLFSIRERLELRGGELVLRSTPGDGTHASVRVPLDEG